MEEGQRQDAVLDYWRGHMDSSLKDLSRRLESIERSIEMRLESIEKSIEVRHKEHSNQLEHIHVCLERKTKTISLLCGGLIVLYVTLQIVSPFLVRLLVK